MSLLNRIKESVKLSDLVVLIGFFLALTVMMIPIPPLVLDLILASTFSLSVIIFFISVYMKKCFDPVTYPTVLLLGCVTILSINVATTRNIFSKGISDGPEATGKIIQFFGKFVVGNNYVVGIIIFIILAIISLMVIRKGVKRITEVTSKFTFDIMPSKIMAINSDLETGLIDELEAKNRRKEVTEEENFYDAMNGVFKYMMAVVIVGFLITAVNITGGTIVGVAKNNMSFTQAIELFALLSIGDGLVNLIPAFIIFTAAWIIVTRSTNEGYIGCSGKQSY